MGSDLCVCPKCKGDGWVVNHGARVGFGILTLGIGALIDMATTGHPSESMFSYRCTLCKGRGFIRQLGDTP